MHRTRSFLTAIAAGFVVSNAALAASSAQTPQAFMEAFYSHFRNHKMMDVDGKNADLYLTPDLAALQRRYEKQVAAGQDEDPMSEGDGNDFCGCQDTNHPTWKVSIPRQDATTADAIGVFVDQNQKTTVRFSLRHTAAGWRIGDYKVEGPGWSFKRQREHEVDENAKHKPGTYP